MAFITVGFVYKNVRVFSRYYLNWSKHLEGDRIAISKNILVIMLFYYLKRMIFMRSWLHR